MKRILIIIILFIIIIGCNNVEIKEKSALIDNFPTPKISDTNHLKSEVSIDNNETVIQSRYYGTYQMDPKDTFDKIIKYNPIDKDYDKEFNDFQNSTTFSTSGWIDLEEKYIKIWNQEMNEAINKLKSKLNNEEYNLLEESQNEWLQYNSNESGFVIKTFLLKSHFGTQGNVMAETAIRERTRERTIELLEYLYELSDYNLEFLYKGK